MSKRLIRDLQAIKADTEWHFTAEPDESNLSKILATFPGPVQSPYQGGTFAIEFNVPPEYPLKPPRARFATKVFHPNVSSQTGAICLDILKDKWTPVYSLLSILISLQQLLDSPNASDPQDAEVAKVYRDNPEQFKKIAAQWTAEYAHAPKADVDEASVKTFENMGFPREKIVSTFQSLGIKGVSSEEETARVMENLI